MKRTARKEMKDFFKKICKCRPMSHESMIKLKIETKEAGSKLHCFLSMFLSKNTL